ncbi:hypothetical protein KCP73_00065 [Salmonella enterica subsp. enterica]|nr:hypothetical protein KCP73_00065 [Salmonella enterica subsp. enterica]
MMKAGRRASRLHLPRWRIRAHLDGVAFFIFRGAPRTVMTLFLLFLFSRPVHI